MKKITTSILLIFLVSALQGCTAWTKRSSIAFVKDSGGSLSIWDADMSAAVGYETGQICMQRALAIKTIDASTSVKVSEAMLALAGAAQTAVASGKSADLATITASLKETATLLTTSTERTTFLDLGMFYLCQISANGGVTDQQTAELIKVISIAGASINTSELNNAIAAANSVSISSGNNEATPRVSGPKTDTKTKK